MDYTRQVVEISNYLRSGEKGNGQLMLGLEFEQIIIDKETLKSISYYGEGGVAETLEELEDLGWSSTYEGEHILGLNKGNKSITLEPGSQIELSLNPEVNIKDIEREYLEFLEELVPILESKGQGVMAVGYHPETKINEIKILPKKRYDYMFDYFKQTGTHAHNMMKGTAAFQISMDYRDEADYRKKYKVINGLSPVIYGIFENARYFEAEINEKHGTRALIWENTDKARSGIVPGSLEDDFSYTKYAEFVLNTPPILELKDGVAQFTGNKKVKEIFDPENYHIEELEHFLTMVFPDVRTKKFMEIRMMDAVPYPLNLGAAAMWKGILYNEQNLDKVFLFLKDISVDDVNKAKHEMMNIGISAKLKGKTLLDIGRWLVELAKSGLSKDEVEYIYPLEKMLAEGKTPYMITKDREINGKKKALEWCLLNDVLVKE